MQAQHFSQGILGKPNLDATVISYECSNRLLGLIINHGDEAVKALRITEFS